MQHILGFEGKSVLEQAKQAKHFKFLHDKNTALTITDLSAAVQPDIFLMQAVQARTELNKMLSTSTARLREWLGWSVPEAVHEAHELEELLNAAKNASKSMMGLKATQEDRSAVQNHAEHISKLLQQIAILEQYITTTMNALAPNTSAVATPLLGAELITRAGSLKQLSERTGSIIQLLGAEKALFKHIISGTKCPKYGIILHHPLVQQSEKKGKMARKLAGKIAIAAKVDYFKGVFVGNELLAAVGEKHA